MRRKIGIAVGVIIAVVAIVVCLVPLKEVAYTVTVDYQDTETYYEDEPCEVQITEPLDYEVVKAYEDIDKGTTPIACITLRNIDNVSGTFNIHFTFYAIEKTAKSIFEARYPELTKEEWKMLSRKYRGDVALNLEAGQVGTARYIAKRQLTEHIFDDVDMDVDEWFWEHEVSPGTKTVTKTEYRQVEKQRTVTKQHPETRYKRITLLDYLLHY